MTAGWTAGGVRARGLARHQIGPAAARQLASAPSLRAAQQALAGTWYAAAAPPGRDLASTQHAIAAAVLWDMRVLSGWLPPGGVRLLRTMAGWFEIASTDELIMQLTGHPAGEPFQLGALATAWTRLRDARTLAALRAALATSPWQDPGGDTARDIRLGMRARWAARVAAATGGLTRSWAAGALALLVAGEIGRAGPPQPALAAAARTALGGAAVRSVSLPELRAALPATARWALAGTSTTDQLWRAEAAWWARVSRDGRTLLRSPVPGRETVLGALAILGADARRVASALEIAARGGTPMESYDELA